MRPLSTIIFLFASVLICQAQDGFKFNFGASDAYHIHKNSHGSLMFEVIENNTFFGESAGAANDKGISVTGSNNSFFGCEAGKDNSDGYYNTFLGARSGKDNSTGKFLTFVGHQAGSNNTTANYNTAVGTYSNHYNTIGEKNVAVGHYSNLYNGGSRNTIIGFEAGKGISSYTANNNVFIGYQAGQFETGSNKLYLDNSNTSEPLLYAEFNNNELEVNGDLTIDVPVGSAESRSEIKFAHENTVEFTIDYDGSNDKFEIREGNTQLFIVHDYNIGIKRTPTTNDLEVSGTASKSSAGDWIANSDARLKKNIKPLNSSLVLSKLLQLKGITYEWNDPREEQERPEGEQYGFTAQNIEKVFPELVSTDNEGYLQTSYGTYDAMYIEAIRELCDKIERLEQRITDLEASSKLED